MNTMGHVIQLATCFMSSLTSQLAAPDLSQVRFWDRMARKYAADPIDDLAGYEHTLAQVGVRLRHHQSVLEIGCGTGTTALRLARSVRSYMACDISPEMITIAKEKLAREPVESLHFVVADAQMPPPSWDTGLNAVQRFDVALAFNVLHLVPSLNATLQAIRRLLPAGAVFMSKTACIREMNPLVPWVALPVMRAIGKAPDVLVFDALELQNALERNGFRVEVVQRHGTQGKDIRVFMVARAVD